jgi:hypothetical protein
MSRRLTIAALICGVLGLAFWWLVQNSEWVEVTVPGSLSGEAAQDPFYAATRLVDRLGARSEPLRSLPAVPPTSAVLVITNWDWTVPARSARLQQWVAGGGRLVIDSSTGSIAELQKWTHLSLIYPFTHGLNEETPEDRERFAERIKRCRPMHVATRPGTGLGGISPWQLCGLSIVRRLVPAQGFAWGIGDEYGLQAVRLAVGQGSVFYADGMPFTYKTLIQADDARLFVAATQLRRDDLVYFLRSAPADSLFYLLWHEAAAAVCLLLLGAGAYAWRSGVRFAPPLPVRDSARRSLAEQIRGTAQFLRRGGDAPLLHAAVLAALESASQRKLTGYGRLAAEERLQLLARRTGLDAERLRGARAWREFHGTDGLTESIALLETARRRLLTGATS